MLLQSFKTFFKIGLFTLGGGYAMIPLIEKEIVDRHRWMAREELMDVIAIAQSCPGVFAINVSTFVGYRLRKTRGAVCTTLGTALPSYFSSPCSSAVSKTTPSWRQCSEAYARPWWR